MGDIQSIGEKGDKKWKSLKGEPLLIKVLYPVFLKFSIQSGQRNSQ